MRTPYPAIEPFAVHRFQRGHHLLYVEECGVRDGLPVVFLHGGPGSGCKVHHRSFFDPARYRIILIDQRGAGRSIPQGELRHNTTADLLHDLEWLRQRLGVDRWLLFGGSWGAALALLYAQQHPAKVSGLVLRGSFLARQSDLEWFIGDRGVSRIYPERWEHLMACFSQAERKNPLATLYQRLTGDDELARRRAAREWSLWGGQVALAEAFDPGESGEHVTSATVDQARIELHYAVNRYFIPENALLDRCAKLSGIPAILIHGRRDLVCPLESAWTLHRHLPGSELWVLPQSGHIAAGDEMVDALVRAADLMAERLAP